MVYGIAAHKSVYCLYVDPCTAPGMDGVHGVPVLTPVEAKEHKLDIGSSADTPLVGVMDVQDPRHRHRPVTGSVIMQLHHSPGTVRVRSRSGTDAATNVSQGISGLLFLYRIIQILTR